MHIMQAYEYGHHLNFINDISRIMHTDPVVDKLFKGLSQVLGITSWVMTVSPIRKELQQV